MLTVFYYLLLFFILFASLMIIFTNNPINAVLFLISVFFNLSFLLILSGFDFFGFLFLLIYIGAIAIFFLFILMMVNIPLYVNKKIFLSAYLSSLIIFVSFCGLNFFLKEYYLFFLSQNLFIFDIVALSYSNTVEIVGVFLYLINWPLFLGLAYILLIAIISSLLLISKLS
jgi:NADH-quinone oxidoreductase subunit J